MPAKFDIQTQRYVPNEDDAINYWIHSGTGSNTARGEEGTPLASTEEALGRLPTFLWGRRAVLRYLPGHVETVPRKLLVPPIVGAGSVDDFIDFATETEVDPALDYIRSQLRLQAEPGTIDDLTAVITPADVTSGLLRITDATKAWTVNEHRGRVLINPGAPAEHGLIWGNTATELLVASLGYSGNSLRIVGTQAELTLGNAAESGVPSGLLFTAGGISTALVGLTIRAAAGAAPALDIAGPGSVAVLACQIRGGFQVRNASATVTVDASWLRDGAYAPNAGTLAVRQCLLSGMTANFHAVTGQYDLLGCRVEACGPMGHGGTSTPHGGFRIDQCWIVNGTSDGVFYGGGVRARVFSTRIDDCAGDAIKAEGNGMLALSAVAGTGSNGRGCRIDLGANVVPSAVTVSGDQGEVIMGGNPFNWAQAPQFDSARQCRFGA